jgi:hypothetical protein
MARRTASSVVSVPPRWELRVPRRCVRESSVCFSCGKTNARRAWPIRFRFGVTVADYAERRTDGTATDAER